MQKLEQGPTLGTIKMVEKVIQDHDNSNITIAELKRALPKQVNHNTLKLILEYLQESMKIYIGVRGITWIENKNPNLQKAIREGIEH